MKAREILKGLLTAWCALSLSCLSLKAQDRYVRGVVTDANTKERLEYIAVYFKNTTDGCITNSKGEFFLRNTQGADTLVVEAIGYKKFIYGVHQRSIEKLDVALEQESIKLDGVYVKPKREKYRNKGNPAVELIQKVINNSDKHRIETQPYYSSDVYEKLTLSLDDLNSNKLEKDKYKFLYDYIDTSEVTGKAILTLSVRENTGIVYYRNHPETRKVVRTAQRLEGIDEELDVNGGLTVSLEQILTSVNIYDNDIDFLANRFVSPISKVLALSYYKYYIMDTVKVSGSPCIDLAFVPRNPESFGFTGRLYVMADSTYAVKKIQLNFPINSNVNWISKLQIDQEFNQTEEGLWALSREDSYVNFSVIDKWQSVFAHNTRCYDNYVIDPGLASRTDIFNADESVIKPKTLKEFRDTSILNKGRLTPLNERELKVAQLKSDLQKKTNVVFWTRAADIFVSELIPLKYPKESTYFNFAPALSFFGYDYIEKARFKIGGMTTANLSKRWFFNGYAAMGTGDKKLKGQVEVIHSFVPKEYHSDESLKNKLTVSFTYDIYSPEAVGVQNDLATSLKANSVKTYQYVRKEELRYDRQWTNGLTTVFSASCSQMTPATTSNPETLSYKYFNKDGILVDVPHISTAELSVMLRWAPGERQSNAIFKRANIDKDTPIFTLQHKIGVPDILGGDYYYNCTDFSAFKRFRLSFAGFLDTKIVASKVWNAVPWPLLNHPAANSSFSYRRETFNTLTPLEFMMDEYVQWNLTWHMKGLLFNRMPLLKKLSIREVVMFNGIWGNLSDKNNPAMNTNLFVLPLNSTQIGRAPFMEVGFGIENILKIYRIVYFYRLNYGRNDNQTAGFLSGFRLGLYTDF